MLVDDPEALIQWLIDFLPPLCDADPLVLAKYCFALVKKDRPESELKASLGEQLDVFLKSNTDVFVKKLVEVIKSKSYLSAKKTNLAFKKPPDDATVHADTYDAEKEKEKLIKAIASIEAPDSTTKIAKDVLDDEIPLPPTPLPLHSIPIPPLDLEAKPSELESLTLEEKSEEVEPEKKVELKARSEDKKILKSQVREPKVQDLKYRGSRYRRRSRSKDRRTRSKFDRHRRSRSPPYYKRYSSRRSRSRGKSKSRSPGYRSKSPRIRRSRSPIIKFHCRRSRTRSPVTHNPALQENLPSKLAKETSRSKSPVSPKRPRKGPTPDKIAISPSKASDEENERQSISPECKQRSKSLKSGKRHESKSQRCRDYDEQGFCMKGDLCPFDHGTDPVVLEGGALDFNPPTAFVEPRSVEFLPPVNPIRRFPPHPMGLPPQEPFHRVISRPPPAMPDEYTPRNPNMWIPSGPPPPVRNPLPILTERTVITVPPPQFSVPPPPIAGKIMNRELINVSVNGRSENLRVAIKNPLSQRFQQMNSANGNCTLELRKVPVGLNAITHLNQHFSKFGNIVNIQVQYDGDAEAALVQFSSNFEASAAYRSTEAVLNNRFIKIFWHNDRGSNKKEVPTSTTQQRVVRERLISRNPNKTYTKKVSAVSTVDVADLTDRDKILVTEKNLNPGNGDKSVTINRTISESSDAGEDQQLPVKKSQVKFIAADSTQQHQLTSVEIKKRQIETIKKQQELLKAQISAKQTLEKRKSEAIKMKSEVEKRAKQLLEEQMQQVKRLITKLEKNKNTMRPQDKKILLETIKTLQASVEASKKRIKPKFVAKQKFEVVKKVVNVDKKISDLDKEIAKAEKEITDVESAGGIATDLKEKLQLLKLKSVQISPRNRTVSNSSTGSLTFSRTRTISNSSGGTPANTRSLNLYHSGPVVRTYDRYADTRSMSINASGFEREDKLDVISHFSSIGTLKSYAWDKQTPAIIVSYEDRRDAERAMFEGRNLGDRLLTLTWVDSVPLGGKFTEIETLLPSQNQIANASVNLAVTTSFNPAVKTSVNSAINTNVSTFQGDVIAPSNILNEGSDVADSQNSVVVSTQPPTSVNVVKSTPSLNILRGKVIEGTLMQNPDICYPLLRRRKRRRKAPQTIDIADNLQEDGNLNLSTENEISEVIEEEIEEISEEVTIY